jgi:uncharacterized membrane protein YfcA
VLDMLMVAAPWAGLVLLGLLVGTFGTLIGAGGGFLLVPILLLLYPNDSVETITSISLAVVFFNATSGSFAYARLKRIDYRTGVIFAAAGTPGAILGSLATGLLPRGVFDVVFGLVLIVLSSYLLLRGRVIEGHEAPKQSRLLFGSVLSFGVGFLSSILGIGGGIIHVPLLIQFLNYPAHIATATSHFILAIMSFTGTMTHILSGEQVEGARRTIALAAGVLVGAQVGAKLSQRVRGSLILKTLSIGIMGVGLRLAAKAVPAFALLLVAAGAQIGRVDQDLLAGHSLAISSASLIALGASAAGLAVGVTVLAMVVGILRPAELGGRLRRWSARRA